MVDGKSKKVHARFGLKHFDWRIVKLGVFNVTETLIGMGYSRAEIEDSLTQCKYDDVFATYLLLGRKNSDVSTDMCGMGPTNLFFFFLFFLFFSKQGFGTHALNRC